MTKRMVTGLVFVAIFFLLLYILPAEFFVVTMILISFLATKEICFGTGLIKEKNLAIFGSVFASLYPLFYYLQLEFVMIELLICLFVICLFVISIAQKGRISFASISILFFASIILPYALNSVLRIYLMDIGKFYIILPIIAAWGTDVLALFGGLFFGKHKLAPQVSPKKTIEGAISGMLGSIVLVMLYAFLINRFTTIDISYISAAIFGLIGSVVGQIGDLSFSLIKRQSGIKDYGNLLPGHGGILDRFDSIIFTGVATEFLLRFMGKG